MELNNSFNRIGGLKEIWMCPSEQAISFVFDSQETVQKCQQLVSEEVASVNALVQLPPEQRKNERFVEVLRGNNLTNLAGEDAKRVLSYSAKLMGTVGKPTENVLELLGRLSTLFASIQPVDKHPVTIHLVK